MEFYFFIWIVVLHSKRNLDVDRNDILDIKVVFDLNSNVGV